MPESSRKTKNKSSKASRHPKKSTAKTQLEFNSLFVAGTLVSGLLVIGALIYLATNSSLSNRNIPEVQTAILIVLAVSILTFLLFALTLGFRALGLADVAQALGLPPDSIRAFIALMLIMIFVIVSIYAVRVVGEGRYFYLGQVSRDELVSNFRGNDYVAQKIPRSELYDIWQVRELTVDGQKLSTTNNNNHCHIGCCSSWFLFWNKRCRCSKKSCRFFTRTSINHSINQKHRS